MSFYKSVDTFLTINISKKSSIWKNQAGYSGYFKYVMQKKIQEYIANQLQDDLEYDQMTLKEYIDPFTGEPVKRNK